MGDCRIGARLSPAIAGSALILIAILGLAPQALCCRSLRELVPWRTAT